MTVLSLTLLSNGENDGVKYVDTIVTTLGKLCSVTDLRLHSRPEGYVS